MAVVPVGRYTTFDCMTLFQPSLVGIQAALFLLSTVAKKITISNESMAQKINDFMNRLRFKFLCCSFKMMDRRGFYKTNRCRFCWQLCGRHVEILYSHVPFVQVTPSCLDDIVGASTLLQFQARLQDTVLLAECLPQSIPIAA